MSPVFHPTNLPNAGDLSSLPSFARHRSAAIFRAVVLGFLVGTATPGFGQTPAGEPPVENPEQAAMKSAYADGMKAFAEGKYDVAVTDMELILAKAAPDSPLETVYYTLGAAQFNLKQFEKAITSLGTFVTKYPKATKIDDAQFFIGQAQIQIKDYDAAVKTLAPLENKPAFRDQALLLLGTAAKEDGNADVAVAALAKLTAGGLKTSAQGAGAMLLASIYAEKGEPEKSIALLKAVRQNSALLDNVIRMNALAIELGDGQLQQEKAEAALASYQLVQSKPEVIRQQQERIATMERQVTANLAAVQADPQRAAEISATNERLRRSIAQTKEQLATFEKTPDFEAPFWLRVARAYYGMDKKWEALAIYDELLRRYPDGPEKEPALFGMTVTSAEVNRGLKTRDLAEAYLKAFPNGANANTVGYLLGASALQSGDSEAAVKYFGRMLAEQTDSTYREEITFMLGNARFSLGDFEKAVGDYNKYIQAYPSGQHVQEATYRAALGELFAGKYVDAAKLINAYLEKYPSGEFLSDAKYRLAVCKYAASEYEAVVADCDAWLREFPNNPMQGEVLALKGDALVPLEGREGEAVDAYIASFNVAETDEVRSHSMTEGAKLMQKRGEWTRIGDEFQKFVTAHASSPAVVPASFWIAKAKAKEGKPDEAREIIAGVIKQNIKDPRQPAVEQLITQLAQLSVRRKPATSADPANPGTEPSATPTPVDPAATAAAAARDLEALLGDAATSATARARILFAKSELARLRKDTAGQGGDLAAIGELPPASLSPLLLAQVGDYLLVNGQADKAAKLFTQLMESYPKSEYLDFAYNGFGEIAYAKKDYPAALRFFTDAIDKAGATLKLRDVTVGQAKTLLAMGRLEEAKKLFEQIASTREWRGESTAFSVYSLGQIEEKNGRLAEANAFYQRVFVAYGRFLPWVAKAYLSSADCFEKLGKKTEAANTYREMLRNEKLAAFPEFAEARKKLEALGNG